MLKVETEALNLTQIEYWDETERNNEFPTFFFSYYQNYFLPNEEQLLKFLFGDVEEKTG